MNGFSREHADARAGSSLDGRGDAIPCCAVFRADANNVIASGHVMRCLSIAQACVELGVRPIFACADGTPKGLVESRGFAFHCLDSDWDDPQQEVGAMERLLSGLENPVLIVDKPQVDQAYVEQLGLIAPVWFLGSERKVLGPLSGIVNYSASIDAAWYERVYAGYQTELLLGLEYAPLRREFAAGRIAPRSGPGCARVLVTMGGSDNSNFTAMILRAIAPIAEECGVVLNVVVGGMFACADLLEAEFGASSCVSLHRGVSEMASLMRGCDIAISANGTTVYELFACGLPVILFAMNSEQRRDAASFQGLGAAFYCGCLDDGQAECAEAIGKAFSGLVSDGPRRDSLARKGLELVDGWGAFRIASALRETALKGITTSEGTC